jgi:hypothetical protein
LNTADDGSELRRHIYLLKNGGGPKPPKDYDAEPT